MKSVIGQLVFLGAMVSLSAALTSCAQGSPAAPVNEITAPQAAAVPTCPNGKIDPGEMCECPAMATTQCALATPMTCDVLMSGTKGNVLCDAKTCTFSLVECMGTATGTAGTSH
jgi:hypothetical protein